MRRCKNPDCCDQDLEHLNSLLFPVPDKNKPVHFKTFADVKGAKATEELIPSNVTNVPKVAETEQLKF